MKLHQVVAALLIDTQGICLVQQQGPHDLAPSWALPGGMLEEGELIHEGLAREVLEETGLKVETLGRLVYTVQLHSPQEDLMATAHVLQVVKWSGLLQPSDPDRLILRVEFAPLRDAIAKLQTAPTRVMWEPMVAYLRGGAPAGTVWCYRRADAGDDQVVARIDGLGSSLR